MSLRATVDTGFNDYLMLPYAVIIALGMPYLSEAYGDTAGGGEVESTYHRATVIWDGETRRVPAIVADGKPLIGMLMFCGYELRFVSEIGEIVTLRTAPFAPDNSPKPVTRGTAVTEHPHPTFVVV